MNANWWVRFCLGLFLYAVILVRTLHYFRKQDDKGEIGFHTWIISASIWPLSLPFFLVTGALIRAEERYEQEREFKQKRARAEESRRLKEAHAENVARAKAELELGVEPGFSEVSRLPALPRGGSVMGPESLPYGITIAGKRPQRAADTKPVGPDSVPKAEPRNGEN